MCKPKCFGNVLVTARVNTTVFPFLLRTHGASVLEVILEMTPSTAPTLVSNYEIHFKRFSMIFKVLKF